MNRSVAATRMWAIVLVLGLLGSAPLAWAQTQPTSESRVSADDIRRIREEGLNHSQAMATLSYLTDVIGPRLTRSPNLHWANEWTRDNKTKWGLEDAHLGGWGALRK